MEHERSASAEPGPSTRRKVSTARKEEAKKKDVPNHLGIWVCATDGCPKMFAREADLKRHRRTTKLHSRPGFTCTQCDASFSRADALRRHHKSRHIGFELPDFETEAQAEESTARAANAGRNSSIEADAAAAAAAAAYLQYAQPYLVQAQQVSVPDPDPNSPSHNANTAPTEHDVNDMETIARQALEMVFGNTLNDG